MSTKKAKAVESVIPSKAKAVAEKFGQSFKKFISARKALTKPFTDLAEVICPSGGRSGLKQRKVLREAAIEAATTAAPEAAVSTVKNTVSALMKEAGLSIRNRGANTVDLGEAHERIAKYAAEKLQLETVEDLAAALVEINEGLLSGKIEVFETDGEE